MDSCTEDNYDDVDDVVDDDVAQKKPLDSYDLCQKCVERIMF